MRVFVAFGYNQRDQWIKNLVVPFLETLEVEVLTGEDLHGKPIDDGVRARIERSNGLLAFLTKRGDTNETHHWVRDELVAAVGLRKNVFEIREEGVQIPSGIASNRQYLTFSPANKEQVFLDLIKVIKQWELGHKRLVVLPSALVTEIAPKLSRCRCFYNYLDDDQETNEEQATILRIGQGLCLDIKNIPHRESLIKLRIEGPDNLQWVSSYTSLQNVSINFEKQL